MDIKRRLHKNRQPAYRLDRFNNHRLFVGCRNRPETINGEQPGQQIENHRGRNKMHPRTTIRRSGQFPEIKIDRRTNHEIGWKEKQNNQVLHLIGSECVANIGQKIEHQATQKQHHPAVGGKCAHTFGSEQKAQKPALQQPDHGNCHIKIIQHRVAHDLPTAPCAVSPSPELGPEPGLASTAAFCANDAAILVAAG